MNTKTFGNCTAENDAVGPGGRQAFVVVGVKVREKEQGRQRRFGEGINAKSGWQKALLCHVAIVVADLRAIPVRAFTPRGQSIHDSLMAHIPPGFAACKRVKEG